MTEMSNGVKTGPRFLERGRVPHGLGPPAENGYRADRKRVLQAISQLELVAEHGVTL